MKQEQRGVWNFKECLCLHIRFRAYVCGSCKKQREIIKLCLVVTVHIVLLVKMHRRKLELYKRAIMYYKQCVNARQCFMWYRNELAIEPNQFVVLLALKGRAARRSCRCGPQSKKLHVMDIHQRTKSNKNLDVQHFIFLECWLTFRRKT
jgi:hypothetical protein